MKRLTYLKKIFLLHIRFEICKKATDNAAELAEVYALTNILEERKKYRFIYLLIYSLIYQSDVANMKFYNRKIVILSNK